MVYTVHSSHYCICEETNWGGNKAEDSIRVSLVPVEFGETSNSSDDISRFVHHNDCSSSETWLHVSQSIEVHPFVGEIWEITQWRKSVNLWHSLNGLAYQLTEQYHKSFLAKGAQRSLLEWWPWDYPNLLLHHQHAFQSALSMECSFPL